MKNYSANTKYGVTMRRWAMYQAADLMGGSTYGKYQYTPGKMYYILKEISVKIAIVWLHKDINMIKFLKHKTNNMQSSKILSWPYTLIQNGNPFY